MSSDDIAVALDLKKLVRQVNAVIQGIEADIQMFPMPHHNPGEIRPGYEIGDFVITPRFPKTDFQG